MTLAKLRAEAAVAALATLLVAATGCGTPGPPGPPAPASAQPPRSLRKSSGNPRRNPGHSYLAHAEAQSRQAPTQNERGRKRVPPRGCEPVHADSNTELCARIGRLIYRFLASA